MHKMIRSGNIIGRVYLGAENLRYTYGVVKVTHIDDVLQQALAYNIFTLNGSQIKIILTPNRYVT